MSDVTQINTDIQAGNPTVVNSEINNGTVINPQIVDDNSESFDKRSSDSNATTINAALSQGTVVNAGTILCDEYIVEQKLDTVTGEADLYLCQKDGKHYVAKVYRRKIAVKDEIIQKLTSIASSNVAKVYASGDFNGYPVEVIPYYKNGSLQGKKYTYIELKKHIIPSLNEGLHVLHENGIIHKDLKPSNIMLNDNGVDVSIIDFGISSVRESGNTVIVTQTGMTPEYSAPETFKNLFLSESDYYSFGITIYELFCGHTPYTNMSAEDIEKYVSVQRIPCPEDMPNDLKDFIGALTYYDITNRKNKSNPNRRWGYEEVKKWCAGEQQTIPGEGVGNSYSATKIAPYKFLGHSYDDKGKLVNALAMNWNEGKKQLFRGLLSGFFKSVDPEIAGYCLDAEDEAMKTTGNDDIIFFKTLYKIAPDTTVFYWEGKTYENLEALGGDLLQRLWKNDAGVDSFFGSILGGSALTIYATAVGAKDKNIISSLQGLESSYRTLGKTKENRIRVYYLMAYMLSGKKVLNIWNNQFDSINDVALFLDELVHASYTDFDKFCRALMSERGELNPQFESWLIALGKQNEIKNWRKGLM